MNKIDNKNSKKRFKKLPNCQEKTAETLSLKMMLAGWEILQDLCKLSQYSSMVNNLC